MNQMHDHRSRHHGVVAGLLTAVAISAGAAGTLAPSASAAPPKLEALKLAGSNGEAAKAPKQIFRDAEKATEGAKTVRIVGSLATQSKTGATSFDLVAGHGEGGGVIRLGAGTDQFDLVVKGTTQYLKANAATWTTSAGSKSVATALADHWVRTGTTEIPSFTLSHLANIDYLATHITVTASGTKRVTTFSGRPAIKLADSEGNAVYVAASGTPYLLGVVSSGGSDVYSEYGTAHPPSVPKGPYFNGEVFKTSQAVFADAQAATDGAMAVHVTGSVPAKTSTSASSFDVVAGHGVGGGTIGIGTGSAKFTLVADGKELYLKADAATWDLSTGSQSAGRVLGDKWIKTSGIKGLTLGNFLNLDYLVGHLTARNLQVAGITTFDGQPTVRLDDGKGDSFYVAAQGAPYVVALVSATAQEHYSDYGTAKVPPVPKDAVSGSSLGLESSS